MIETFYSCEICGDDGDNKSRWVVIQCDDAQLTLFRWSEEAALKPEARHYCGEAHAQVYVNRWFSAKRA